MSFEEYGLSPEILSGLADVRIDQPTPLQNEVLPAALQGKHLLVKTDAEDEGTFLIPALQKIAQQGEVSGTQVLILTPSIERAKKIDELIWAIGYHAQISSALLAMKGNKDEQTQAVLDGAPVIVANPGRLIEILEKNNFHLRDLKLIVIDEAHNMQDFNLVSRVKDILRFVNGDPQTLILSTNENDATRQLVKAALKNPELIGFNGESVSAAETEDSSQDGEVSSPDDVDLEKAKEKLEKAEVEVVLNPESESESKAEETSEEDDTDTEATIEEKLEETEVEVVLNPESESEENNDQKNEQEATVEEKLEEAEVEVVLNPESSSESNGDSPEESDTREISEKSVTKVDLEAAEKKLKEVSVKVVLKKDLPDEPENSQGAENDQDKKVEVEPVLANPVLQDTNEPAPVPKGLEQGFINVPPRMKISTLMAHLEESSAKKVIVFAASKRTTDRLFRIIRKKKWGVVSVSAGIDEETYNERFARFTSGEMRILLVGGMEAKEVEIEEVQEVINYDVPSEVEEYRYRAELVGNGKAAQIISLVSKMDREDIDRITNEVGFPPVELPLPAEVEEKKKGGNTKSKGKSRNNSGGSSRGKKSDGKDDRRRSNKRGQSKGNKNDRKSRKRKKLELPRPTYDGLSGGRDGHEKKESGGVFGWVKKLFN